MNQKKDPNRYQVEVEKINHAFHVYCTNITNLIQYDESRQPPTLTGKVRVAAVREYKIIKHELLEKQLERQENIDYLSQAYPYATLYGFRNCEETEVKYRQLMDHLDKQIAVYSKSGVGVYGLWTSRDLLGREGGATGEPERLTQTNRVNG